MVFFIFLMSSMDIISPHIQWRCTTSRSEPFINFGQLEGNNASEVGVFGANLARSLIIFMSCDLSWLLILNSGELGE